MMEILITKDMKIIEIETLRKNFVFGIILVSIFPHSVLKRI